MIKPLFEELSRKTSIPTCSVNINVVKRTVKIFKIHAIPTFILFYKGKPKYRVVGADPTGLKKLFQKAKQLKKAEN